MKWLVVASLLAFLVSGCSTMTPARYAVSADTNQRLKKLPGSGSITKMGSSVSYDSNCRLMGPIQAGDGLTIPQFVGQAINDELKFGERFASTGAGIGLDMTKIQFSSTSGLTGGWWDLGVTLTSNTGARLSAENRHEFQSGFDAVTACNQTAQALGAATQDLIKKLVAHPDFTALLKPNR